MKINIPLMDNNIIDQDFDCLVDFLKTKPRMTQAENVRRFEEEWSNWLGQKHSVFVNSGSSANILTMSALKHLYGEGEVILSPFGWISDIVSVIQAGLKPVFVDIRPDNFALNEQLVLEKISQRTRAVLLTHIMGFCGLTKNLIEELNKRGITLIEDVCESYGCIFDNKKLGTFGLASNFSFYYAHHLTTIEGGMVSTNDRKFYETVRMLRSHGMVRESLSEEIKNKYKNSHPDLNPDFIFAYPGYNMRSSEINAVLGLNQLKRLDENNNKRIENANLFYEGLDSQKYKTDFNFSGSVNYAFMLVLNEADESLANKVMNALNDANVEFRRGASGGGNQLRQPYLKNIFGKDAYKGFPVLDHIHFYGFYIGNYPTLEKQKIIQLTELLNSL